MKKKELDWSFWMKMVISMVGMIMLLSFLLGGKAFQKKEDEQQQQRGSGKKLVETNPREPFRIQIMSMNTITLFFLLMSINEYRVSEFTSPFGVDPNKIPNKCRLQQQSYYWIIFLFCLMIVIYNYVALSHSLKKATSKNLIYDKSAPDDTSYRNLYRDKNRGRISSSEVETLIKNVRKIKFKNGMFVVEIYPHFMEFIFFMMLAFFSIIIYFFFVLSNYGVIENQLFKPCANPLNNDRFYDPFAEEEQENQEYY